MTKEEREAAIAFIKGYRKLDEDLHNTAPKDSISYFATARCLKYWDMAIQALSQEPCDDAISREDALKEAYTIVIDGEKFDVVQVETLYALPPVTPSRHVNCEIAEHDGNGCLGYSHYGDDFPIEECLHCPKYTSYEEE